jgi:transposase
MMSPMRDRELYAKLLGIEVPWVVRDVDVRLQAGEVEVFIEHRAKKKLACPTCGAKCPGYDTNQRSWRHLDTMQFRTILTADVPRVECKEHGVKQIDVPWAEPGSRFTALLEIVVIDWLKEASTSAVARMLRMSWDEVDGVMQRAVKRGLARRESQPLRAIGVDETSFQKRHEYVTIVYDTERARVLEVADGRKQEALENFYWDTPLEHLQTVEVVSMDMWPAYITATREHIPDADTKIAFDRFHVAKHLGDAVNHVRKREHAELTGAGDHTLKGTRYLWLKNPENMKPKQRVEFESLRGTNLRVAKAWAMKETARHLWHYVSRTWASKSWNRLLDWMARSRLAPMVKVGQTLRTHLWGIINAIVLGATNAHLEAVNAKIQALKKRACGFRNRVRFRHAILFHAGGLDLHPRLVHAHSKS